ncbi:ribonuclease T2 family protein [Balneatrix alpica]|uniref:ribonuclease T2 family protein n=1 Tax=Balneatrix alpica TaxID=75684 RepID=UPI002739391A|nr:hypothetical protein [Balneatrix alpica]
MRKLIGWWVGVCLSVLSGSVWAASCQLPEVLETPRLEKLDCQNQQAQVNGFLLALSWSPSFCASQGDRPANRHQCQDNQFRWVVHGLWPQDYNAKAAKCSQPRHCQSSRVDQATLAQYLCTVPGVQLMQAQWQKHGSCAFNDPGSYFAQLEQLHQRLQLPELTESKIQVEVLQQRFIELNPGLQAEHMLVRTGKGNRFNEVWLCMDQDYRYRRCNGRGAPASAIIQVPQ